MKIVLMVGVALCCVMALAARGQAQPDGVATGHSPVVTLRLENVPIAEVAKAIAAQGQVSIVLAADVTGQIPTITLDKATPEAALETLAQAAHLVLTKLNDQTFRLGQKPLNQAPPTAIQAPANFFVIRVQLGNGLTQEIQVALCSAFHVTTTVDNAKWSIKGANELKDNEMKVDLSVERQLTTPDHFVARQSLKTQFVTPPDGHEMTLSDTNSAFPIVASVQPIAPAAK